MASAYDISASMGAKRIPSKSCVTRSHRQVTCALSCVGHPAHAEGCTSRAPIPWGAFGATKRKTDSDYAVRSARSSACAPSTASSARPS
jgi:hypothetical protein